MPGTPTGAQTGAFEHRIEFSEGAPCSLARKLIAEGKVDRSDRLTTLRDGEPALSGAVGWFADRRLQETTKVGPRYVKWTPFPGAASLGQTASSPSEAE
jgi:hypothetical protein